MQTRFAKLLALATIVLLALNLRTAVSSISPIANYIAADFALPILTLALLGIAAPLAFAISPTLSSRPVRKYGLEVAILGLLLMIIFGHLARALAWDSTSLFAGSLLSLLGAGMGNVLMPVLVRKYFAHRIGLISSIYISMTAVSATAGSFFAAPAAEAFGWRGSLLQWSVFAALVLIPLLPLTFGKTRTRTPSQLKPARLNIQRSPTAWAISTSFAISSVFGYTSFAFMPVLLIERHGLSAIEAGALLALFAICGLPVAIFVPILVAKTPRTQPLIIVGAAILGTAGSLGMMLGPTNLLWLSVTAFGLLPTLFPLALTLFNLRCRERSTVLSLSAFGQGFGYSAATITVLSFGLLREITGAWTASLTLVAALAALSALVAIQIAKQQFVEDELSAKH
jgi:CP family cyanate transporter-like MFS transporter